MADACPFEALIAAHALGALDDEERTALERHLAAGCDVCAPELAAMGRVAEAIAMTASPVRPREELRSELVTRAAAVRPFRPRQAAAPPVAGARRAGRGLALAASIAVLLAVGALAWGVVLQGRLEHARQERQALATDLAAARAQLARGEVERVALLRHLAVLGASRLQQVQLAALPPAPAARGRMFLDPGSGQAVFSAAGLPPLPADRTYQLWFITGGRPVSAGTFDVGGEGSGRLLVDGVRPAAPIDAWAVTVEPAGGVPQPTGSMVLKS
ncbi:MAG TPA: anti-sigma factor [Thermoanaerobaculia bacterium]|jgi:anti-sigma-K factor RskA|nr:anti-sigma factor [Thermoanaerobaculia bacterium]